MYRNEYEFRVFGMKRSGNHAIINWIATLFDEPVYFFNNCGYGCDPYRTGRTRGTRKKTDIKDIFILLPRMKNFSEDEIEPYRSVVKKCIIYSYENILLSRLLEEPPTLNRSETIGESKHRFEVLILRDVYNWAASSFVHCGRSDDNYFVPTGFDCKSWKRREVLFEKWKTHAHEFLGDTKYLAFEEANIVCISYNDWLRKRYREKTASKFGLQNNERSIDIVAGVGNRGSKFDNFIYDGRASRMKVLERWKYFKDNPYFWGLFDDESIELSNEIFGEILS